MSTTDPLTVLTAAFWGALPESPGGGIDAQALARKALDALTRPGLAVVELPGPDCHESGTDAPGWLDPRSDNHWWAYPEGVLDDFGALRNADEVRNTALIMLAAAAESDRKAGEKS